LTTLPGVIDHEVVVLDSPSRSGWMCDKNQNQFIHPLDKARSALPNQSPKTKRKSMISQAILYSLIEGVRHGLVNLEFRRLWTWRRNRWDIVRVH
jgi:hypothetical protein